MLSIQDGGVYVVQFQVDGAKSEYHAATYDSTGIIPGPYKAHSGVLIDNRKKKPVYMIEDKDRASVENKRKVLNTMYS